MLDINYASHEREAQHIMTPSMYIEPAEGCRFVWFADYANAWIDSWIVEIDGDNNETRRFNMAHIESVTWCPLPDAEE